MNRAASIAVWTLHVVLGGMFVFQGVVKLASSPGWVSRFKVWGYPDSFYLLIGAIILMAVMVGATITHLAHGELQVITTAVLLLLLAIVAYSRRSSYTQLRDKLKRKN